jgi:hypothetical protein
MAHRLHNRLPRWHRNTVYTLTSLMVISGVAWLVVAYLLPAPGEPTPAPHPLAGPLLAVHGVAAYAALFAYALVGHTHIRAGWRVPVLRAAASWLLASVAVLALTGLGLYYVPSENAVEFLRWGHVAAGAGLPFCLLLHITRGRREARRF